jgi:hypothetical protein
LRNAAEESEERLEESRLLKFISLVSEANELQKTGVFFNTKEIQLQSAEKVKHLNQTQLAERWDVAEATLERWRSDGIGPVFMKIQGRVLYRVEDIETFESDSLRQSTSSAVGGAA